MRSTLDAGGVAPQAVRRPPQRFCGCGRAGAPLPPRAGRPLCVATVLLKQACPALVAACRLGITLEHIIGKARAARRRVPGSQLLVGKSHKHIYRSLGSSTERPLDGIRVDGQRKQAGGSDMHEAQVLVGWLAQLVLAFVFTLSALAKASRPSKFVTTFEQLGLASQLAVWAAGSVITGELVVGVALGVGPMLVWPRAMGGVLAAGFAGAGVWALRSRRRVSCYCFGPGQHRELGKRQVAALPGWLALCLLAQILRPSWPAALGWIVLALMLLMAAAVRLIGAWPLWRELRFDRIAFR